MRLCAAVLLVIATPLAAASVRLGPRRSFCGISVRAPRGYSVEKFVPENSDVHCAIGMKPPKWNEDKSDDAVDLGPYELTLLVTADDFEDAAHRALFDRAGDMRKTDEPPRPDDPPPYPPLSYKDDDWLTSGRMGLLNRAKTIESSSWTGLTGFITRGFSHPRGGNAGIGDVLVASLTSRKKPYISVVISTSGIDYDEGNAIIRAIQIIRRR
jgi:hypothetical protein